MKTTQRWFPGVLLGGLLSLLVFLLAFGALHSIAQESVIPERPSISGMLDRVTPAVVNIAVTGSVTVQNPLYNDPFFRRFFGLPDQMEPQQRQTQSAGSGVIIDAENGYVLTNHHVVNRAEEIEITLQDRRRVRATLIGSDEGTDIALLKIEADNLSAIPRGNSDTLRVGDFVVAIGNPFGIGQTVTSGIVSALGRSGINTQGFEDFIQTDASINPGNSGGALVDYNGFLIGINTAIISTGGGNVGIGFAVPISMANAVVDQLLEFGEVRRGRLGVVIQDVTPDLATALDLDVTEGAVVSSVEPDTPAERAGLEAGDIIVAVNGNAVSNSSALRNRIGLTRAGEEVEISYLRDGQRRDITVAIGERPQTAEAPAQSDSGSVLQGAEVANLPANHPQYGQVSGVLVTSVQQNSRAARNGLRADDIIVAVNRAAVSDRTALLEAVRAAGAGTVAMTILRDNRQFFLVMR